MTRVLGGRYRLETPVGRGGMAVVWRGHDMVLGRRVAVKLLARRAADHPVVDSAVRKEAIAAARLSHPHVARVYDYGETCGQTGEPQPFLVMEFVEGETLAARLAERGRCDWPEAVRICAAVAKALAAAHDRQLVHRDVKPANIMLPGAGVKVVDFGLAARIGHRPEDDDGSIWGTPAYLAPELLRGRKAMPAADVYSLGVLLRTCLAAEPPWPGESIDEVLAARLAAPHRRLPRRPELPPALVRLYEQCTAAHPAARPTARAVVRTLNQLSAAVRVEGRAAGSEIGVIPAVVRHRPGRGPRLALAIAAVVAVVVGALAVQLLTTRPPASSGPVSTSPSGHARTYPPATDTGDTST